MRLSGGRHDSPPFVAPAGPIPALRGPLRGREPPGGGSLTPSSVPEGPLPRGRGRPHPGPGAGPFGAVPASAPASASRPVSCGRTGGGGGLRGRHPSPPVQFLGTPRLSLPLHLWPACSRPSGGSLRRPTMWAYTLHPYPAFGRVPDPPPARLGQKPRKKEGFGDVLGLGPSPRENPGIPLEKGLEYLPESLFGGEVRAFLAHLVEHEVLSRGTALLQGIAACPPTSVGEPAQVDGLRRDGCRGGCPVGHGVLLSCRASVPWGHGGPSLYPPAPALLGA